MENHQLQTCLLIFPAAERESGSCLRQAFPENVIFWELGGGKSYYVVYKAQNNTENKQIQGYLWY